MLSDDFRNAVWNIGDSFNCKLFQLLLSADNYNFDMMAKGYPVPAMMVYLYNNDCSYCFKNGIKQVDYDMLLSRAEAIRFNLEK